MERQYQYWMKQKSRRKKENRMKKWILYGLILAVMSSTVSVNAASIQGLPKQVNIRSGEYNGGYLDCASDRQDAFYYVDKNKKFHAVLRSDDTKSLIDCTINSKGKVTNKKVIKYRFPKFGGFYTKDGDEFYVVTGRDNTEENDNKVVIAIEKYNSNWKKVGVTAIRGSFTDYQKGIVEPFRSGACRMSESNGRLIVHTSRKLYKSEDGLNHQRNLTLLIDTNTMKLVNNDDYQTRPYCSHSFNQFVVAKGNSVYYLDHGDAYPRAVQLTKCNLDGTKFPNEGNGTYYQILKAKLTLNIFDISGNIGDNETGVQTTGFELVGDNLVSVGKYHNFKDKFLDITSEDLSSHKLVNLGACKEGMSDLKLVKLSDKRFALLYSVRNNNKIKLFYREFNTNGKLVGKKTYSGKSMETNSQPYFDGKNIQWIAISKTNKYGYNTYEYYSITVK